MTPRRTAGPVDAEKSLAAILKPLDARAVTIEGGVWARAQAVNHDAALPHGHRMLEAAGDFEKLPPPGGRPTRRHPRPRVLGSDRFQVAQGAPGGSAPAPRAWVAAA